MIIISDIQGVTVFGVKQNELKHVYGDQEKDEVGSYMSSFKTAYAYLV